MAKKKTRSREETEQLLEIMEIENKRLTERLHRAQAENDMIRAEFNALPQWMRRWAEKRYDRRMEK